MKSEMNMTCSYEILPQTETGSWGFRGGLQTMQVTDNVHPWHRSVSL